MRTHKTLSLIYLFMIYILSFKKDTFFNSGLRHPQYIGAVFSIWGGLGLIFTPKTLSSGVALLIIWTMHYIWVSIMEEGGSETKTD